MKRLLIPILVLIFSILGVQFSFCSDIDYPELHYNTEYDIYESNERYDTIDIMYEKQIEFVKKHFPYSFELHRSSMDYDTPPKHAYTFKKERLKTLEEDNNYVAVWLDNNMRPMIPNNYNTIDVLAIVNDWVCSNVVYKLDQPDSSKPSVALSRGYASCMGYTVLYRDMVEYIPFDPNTELVDWNNPNPTHLDIKMVHLDNHIIDIIYLDNTWYIIDVTFNATGKHNRDYFMITWDKYEFSFVDPVNYYD